MGRWDRWVSAGVLAACVVGCAAVQPSMQIRTDRNPAASFATYATYAWKTAPPQAPAWPAQDDRVSLDWTVRGLVDQQMARLGYQRVDAGQADVVLGYGVRTQEESLDDSFGDYAKYRAQGGTQSPGTAWVMGYERATLLLDATDARTGTLVWYGQASAVVNPSLRAKRLPEAIAKIFASFPPRSPAGRTS